MFQKYRTIFANDAVIEVEAVQLTKENLKEVAVWCDGFMVLEHDALNEDKTFVGLNVPTTLGKRRASEGDYVIHQPGVEFYVHRAESFESLYEKVV